jgi:hypothetical protein
MRRKTPVGWVRRRWSLRWPRRSPAIMRRIVVVSARAAGRIAGAVMIDGSVAVAVWIRVPRVLRARWGRGRRLCWCLSLLFCLSFNLQHDQKAMLQFLQCSCVHFCTSHASPGTQPTAAARTRGLAKLRSPAPDKSRFLSRHCVNTKSEQHHLGGRCNIL